jgi:hypothetical protein
MSLPYISNEERRTLLYKKEFECEKLFSEIVKNKLKNPEIYVEYKKITELKDSILRVFGKDPYYLLDNNPFVSYFTENKKKYIKGLLMPECELLPFVSFSHDDDTAVPTMAATVSNDGKSIAAYAYQCKKYGIVNFNFAKDPAGNNIFITVNEIAK